MYSSIRPARMAAPASVAPPMVIGPPSPALSRVISAVASPETSRVFQSTLSIVEENTTFGVSRQFRANSISAGVALGCWSPVGQEEPWLPRTFAPDRIRLIACGWSSQNWNSSAPAGSSGCRRRPGDGASRQIHARSVTGRRQPPVPGCRGRPWTLHVPHMIGRIRRSGGHHSAHYSVMPASVRVSPNCRADPTLSSSYASQNAAVLTPGSSPIASSRHRRRARGP